MKIWMLLLMFIVAMGLSAVGFSFGPEFGFDFGLTQIDAFDTEDEDDNVEDSDEFASSQWRLYFMIDSNVKKYNLVNYRGRIGYGQIERNYDTMPWDYTYDVICTEHTVGFGMVRRDKMRMWLGPSILLDFMFFDEEENDDYYGTESTDSFVFGFGVGPTFGINFVPTSRFAIGIELAFKYKFEVGSINWEYETESYYGYSETYDESSDIMSDTYMFTFKVFPMLLAGEY